MNARKLLGSSKKRAMVIVLTGLVVIGAPTLFVASKWASEPSQTTMRLADSGAMQTEKPTYQIVRTTFFSTVLPSGWHVQTTVDTASASRLHVTADAPGSSLGRVAITSDVLPNGGLAEVADYHLRVSQPDQYPAFSAPYFPAGAKAFRSAIDNTSYTVFWVQHSRFASVSVSGASSAQAALTLLRAAMIQWSWSGAV